VMSYSGDLVRVAFAGGPPQSMRRLQAAAHLIPGPFAAANSREKNRDRLVGCGNSISANYAA
jgi:hypothetical protein